MPSVEQRRRRRRRRRYSISNGATFWAERKAQTRATVVAAEAMANPSPGVAHASATLTGASPIRSIHRKFPVRRSACDARRRLAWAGRVTPTRRRLPVDLRAIPAGRAVICARCDLTPALATGIHELVDVCPPPNRRPAGAPGPRWRGRFNIDKPERIWHAPPRRIFRPLDDPRRRARPD